ncbi:MAG: antibiotic biosynthesis monooxygenase [Alphaproteobacteria bacterium]|nr:antibiotic biosynthesis monooxygenase [Alphaproteobacteria bacterium]
MIVVAGWVIAKPGTLDEMKRIALEHVHRSRSEPGCIEHGVYVDAENPLKLHFFERWADELAIKAHFAVPESRSFARQLRALAADKGEMHVLTADKAVL